MRDRSAESAEKIIREKFFRSPDHLQLRTEHPEHEHIDENMHEVAVQEHVGKKLPGIKITGAEGPKIKISRYVFIDRNSGKPEIPEKHFECKDGDIRNKQHPDNRSVDKKSAVLAASVTGTAKICHE